MPSCKGVAVGSHLGTCDNTQLTCTVGFQQTRLGFAMCSMEIVWWCQLVPQWCLEVNILQPICSQWAPHHDGQNRRVGIPLISNTRGTKRPPHTALLTCIPPAHGLDSYMEPYRLVGKGFAIGSHPGARVNTQLTGKLHFQQTIYIQK